MTKSAIKKIAVFGSAFNPPTRGHADVITQLQQHAIRFDEILLIPSYQHAFGKKMADYQTRCELLQLFIEDITQAPSALTPTKVTPCFVEHLIEKEQGAAIYTYDVLTFLEQRYQALNDHQQYEMHFIIGPDNLANWDKFYKAQEIKQRWQLVAVPQQQDIRSTYAREALENSLDNDREALLVKLQQYLTPSVAEYLITHNVYSQIKKD
ncbi:nicotinate-nicotinamide nucleotide adenylyltransferase [Flocculibacter collagenilyticus]|uniref:nicotinate-nicotinamide nucleotide adenylyltransferase n=1 Tax=Flocculibacter collagenilyticus TaxID=2744479 RepID=UPI0018F3ACDB|nr:nicotinate-nicotinamide nucleotide adenylyltransferase [Flocculibacter collagenilyticus]